MVAPLILHVGLPRAGTRYLRNVLTEGRPQLTASGVAAVLPDDPAAADADVFRRARDLLLRHRGGPVVLSTDALVDAGADVAARALDVLGADAATTTVVVTARDLGRSLPARWQGEVEAGAVEEFEPWLRARLSDREAGTLPASFDLPRVASTWRDVVGDRVAVVPVPQHGLEPELLWTRFAVATGLPAGLSAALRAVQVTATVNGPAGHVDDVPVTGLQVQLLRAVNEALRGDGYPVRVQQRLRVRLLGIWRGLGPAGPGQSLRVPADVRPGVRDWARSDVARLRELGIRLIGPGTDLDPVFGVGAEEGSDEGAPTLGLALGRDVVALLVADRLGAPPPSWFSRRFTGGRRRVLGRRDDVRLGSPLAVDRVPAPRVTDSWSGGRSLSAALEVDVRDVDGAPEPRA